MSQPEIIEGVVRPLAIRDEPEEPRSLSLLGSDDPAVALDRAVGIANVLKKLIVTQGYAKKLGRGDREFVEVAGWQALGGFLDTFAQVEWSRPIERGFESRVQLIRRGQVVGAGEAICTRDERNWKDRDDFAIKSMSQTRAAGKAFRLTFGWLMTIAGYEATPAEEMPAASDPQKPVAPTIARADDAADRERKALLRAIHTAQGAKGIDVESYRELVYAIGGDASLAIDPKDQKERPTARNLSVEDLKRLLEAVEAA